MDNWIIKDLEKSGISMEDIDVEAVESEAQLIKYLGRAHFNGESLLDNGGYFIKYLGIPDYVRLKLKTPIGKVKYIAPDGSNNRLYIPSVISEMVKNYDPDNPISFTEGEKKAACATKNGFPTVGIPGVFGFQDKEGVTEDFNSINLKNRKCNITYDSDISQKTGVRQAELRLADNISNKGGKPLSVRFPQSEEKVGLDDFIVKNGADEFRKLVENARDTFELHIEEGTGTEIILKEIAKLNKPIIKEQVIKKLAIKLKVPTETVRKELKSIEQRDNKANRDAEDDKEEIYTQEEIEKAKRILQSSDLLEQVLKQIRKNGYVGEIINITLLYLSFTSRLFDEAISNVIKGDSATGKSSLIKTVLNLFPKSVYYEFTAITQQALFYLCDMTLSHKIMIIFESHGSEKADYPIRSMLSERELRLLVTLKNPETGLFESREIIIPAHGLSYTESTTKSKIHNENQTRLFDLYLDQSEKQTREILLAKTRLIDKNEVEKQNRVFQAMQLLLEPYEVHIPYAEYLAENFPTDKVRIRRDFPRFLILIKSACLLFQYQREKIIHNETEYLIATADDYKIAHTIAKVILAQTLKELTPRQESILDKLSSEFCMEEFAIRDIKLVEGLNNIPYSTLRSVIKDLSKMGYLDWNGEKGKKSMYKVIDEPKIFLNLPTPDTIASLLAQAQNLQSLQQVKYENKAIAQSSSNSSKEDQANQAKNELSLINKPNYPESLDNSLSSYPANEGDPWD